MNKEEFIRLYDLLNECNYLELDEIRKWINRRIYEILHKDQTGIKYKEICEIVNEKQTNAYSQICQTSWEDVKFNP